MATRSRRRNRDRPTPMQAARYGPRGGRSFEVVQPDSSSSNGNGGGFKFPSPTGGSSAGTKIFLLTAAILVLYLVFSGHISPVLTALKGSMPAHPKVGSKTKGAKKSG